MNGVNREAPDCFGICYLEFRIYLLFLICYFLFAIWIFYFFDSTDLTIFQANFDAVGMHRGVS